MEVAKKKGYTQKLRTGAAYGYINLDPAKINIFTRKWKSSAFLQSIFHCINI